MASRLRPSGGGSSGSETLHGCHFGQCCGVAAATCSIRSAQTLSLFGWRSVRVVCFASALLGGIFLSPALLVSVFAHLLPGATVPAACQALGRALGLIPLARSTLALGPAL